MQQRAIAMSALSEIARLPARQRQAMIGTALDGRPRAEIARSMGLSEGAVRQLVHRARSTLRSGVTALTPWPLARWFAAVGPDRLPARRSWRPAPAPRPRAGVAIKLGALLASGTFLTGAAVQLQGAPAHRAHPRVATSVDPPRAIAILRSRGPAAAVPVALVPGRSSGPQGAPRGSCSRRAASGTPQNNSGRIRRAR